MLRKSLISFLVVLSILLFASCDDKASNPKEEKVKVTIVYNNGTEPKVEEITKGSEYTFPVAPPIDNGHAFTGWFIGDVKHEAGSKTIINTDTTITAEYEVIPKVTVTIVYADGTNQVEKIIEGSEYTLPAAQDRYGFEFIGWIVGEKEHAAESKITINTDTTITEKNDPIDEISEQIYEFASNGDSYQIKKFNDKKQTDLIIPRTYEGLPVTSIGKDAFYDCTDLTSVTIPGSVISIGEMAFYGCTNLKSVIIPSSVTTISDYTFYGCTSLTGVTIPSSVISIGKDAFYGCTGLTSVSILDGVTTLGEMAFYGCTSLTSVEIPDSVTTIGNNAFAACSSLASVIIPSSVTRIGENAFVGCTDLTKVTISGNVEIGGRAFIYCNSFSVIFSEGVTEICSGAFALCTGLTSVEIPGSVTTIGEMAFAYCDGLKNVTIPSSVTTIGEMAFYGCTGLTSFSIPKFLKDSIDYPWGVNESIIEVRE